MDTALRTETRELVRDEIGGAYHRAFVKVMSRTLWVLQATTVILVVALKL